MPYSLADIVVDGRLRARRWQHHLVKIATSGAIASGLALLSQLLGNGPQWIAATILGGPIYWLLLVAKEWRWPTDPEPLTRWQHIADWCTDCSLSCVPLVVVVFLDDRLGGVLLAGALVAAYVGCHQDARP